MNWLPYLNKKEEIRLFFKAADLKNDLIWLRMFRKESYSGIVVNENYIRSRHVGIFQEGILIENVR